MKKVMFYCQHVLGMGHFIRSMALIQGLKEFQVCFLNGGEIVSGFQFPDSIEVVNLPPLKSDGDFKEIQAVDDQSLAEIKAARAERLLAEFERFQPDVVIIELFPFGRKKFAFELVPLLARIRLSGSKTKVVCSLRDILVSRPDQARYEAWVCDLMNRYFEALLIHADHKFQRLEETFLSLNDLKAEIYYTGYVAQALPKLPPTAAEAAELAVEPKLPLILVSIGGGRVGYELLACAIEASQLIQVTFPHRMLLFGGPYLPREQFDQLQLLAADKLRLTLRKYTPHFPWYLSQADLSLSMAGYNTCMDIVTTGVRAIVWPFTGGNDNEQTIRANKLEQLGLVSVLRPGELQPLRLAEKIVCQLRAETTSATLDTNGVEKTAAFLTQLTQSPEAETKQKFEPAPTGPGKLSQADFKMLTELLRPALERLQAESRTVHLFLRDDDIDEAEESLRHLLDISLSRGVPLNLEIIPGRLTDPTIKLLKNHKRFLPALLEFNQHGWQHLNHEKEGRKCEFGPARSFEQQLEDISRGKTLLEDTFGDRFYPVFTPPWNRCTTDTFEALDQLEFKVLSKDREGQPTTGYRFQEISTTLDLFHWKGGATLKSPIELVKALIDQFEAGQPIGLLLHHKVMAGQAFSFLDWLLAELRQYPNLQFQTFQSLLPVVTTDNQARPSNPPDFQPEGALSEYVPGLNSNQK